MAIHVRSRELNDVRIHNYYICKCVLTQIPVYTHSALTDLRLLTSITKTIRAVIRGFLLVTSLLFEEAGKPVYMFDQNRKRKYKLNKYLSIKLVCST